MAESWILKKRVKFFMGTWQSYKSPNMGSAGEGMARRANEGPCWCDVGGRRGRDHLGWVTWGTQGCGPQLGVILPTMGHLAMSEVILGGGNAAGISWAETKDAAKCPTVHGMPPPHNKE